MRRSITSPQSVYTSSSSGITNASTCPHFYTYNLLPNLESFLLQNVCNVSMSTWGWIHMTLFWKEQPKLGPGLSDSQGWLFPDNVVPYFSKGISFHFLIGKPGSKLWNLITSWQYVNLVTDPETWGWRHPRNSTKVPMTWLPSNLGENRSHRNVLKPRKFSRDGNFKLKQKRNSLPLAS